MFAGVLIALLLALYVFVVITPTLPDLDKMTDYKPKIPLRIYTADKALIGEFGEEHRDFTPFKDIPAPLKQALIDTEDAHFYQHGGVYWPSCAMSMARNIVSFKKTRGCSTLTMELAREFYLTREKKYARKITEVALAYKIEGTLSKDQILELYMNQVSMGEHAYGFASASQTYFGKPLNALTLGEMAMLAGLPQLPSRHNPIADPDAARERQQHVLRRMHDLGHITDAEFDKAMHDPIVVRPKGANHMDTHAEFVAEAVRQQLLKQYKDDLYTRGYVVYTTIRKAEQDAAYNALRAGVLDYDRRHGYRGPEANIDWPNDEQQRKDAIDDAFDEHPDSDDLITAVVTEANPKAIHAILSDESKITIEGDGLKFAASSLAANANAQKRIKPGSVIRVQQDGKHRWTIQQLPEVSAAFVALDAQDGSVRALVGGFDFSKNQYDHVNLASRQPGSSFKPFLYSAALEKGFSPGTMINDSPWVLPHGPDNAGPSWEPRNDDGVFDGPITMRTALAKSKNVVSARILQAVTAPYVQNYIGRFGLDPAKFPPVPSMALGTGSVTPMQLAGAYSVFANGGFQISPYMIQKVMDTHGTVLGEAKPVLAGDEANRVLDARNAFVMDSLLHQVVVSGTGAAATQKLGRPDLAGKTGTTSDAVDGWFAGYSGNIVGVSWMGYDEQKSLGTREFGATLALPTWIQYMHVALQGKPVTHREAPEGVVQNEGDWMFSEFVSEGAVKTLGLGDPAASTLEASQPDSERQKIIDMFKGEAH